MSDEAGQVVERRSFDAWGRQRNSNGTPLSSALVTPEVRHGFTGHEMLADLGLIHMNGRLYDPAIGRFLSADPSVQYPDDLQNYNRYSYINNNPLSAIDPSGFGFLSSLFKGVKKLVKGVVKAVKHVLRNPVVRTALAIAAAWYGGVYAGNLFYSSGIADALGTLTVSAYNAAYGAFVGAGAGFAGGFVGSGGDLSLSLKAAVAGGFTGGFMGYMGYGSNYPASRIAANGFSNGVSAKIQGGDFMDGLRAGLMTSMLTFANVKMRLAMIQSSRGNPMNDGTGLSDGMFGDGFKLAGGRFNPDPALVGTVQCSLLGCQQNGPGKILGIPYAKGGFVDMVMESFAGPHDFANSPHFYAPDGTIKLLGAFASKFLDITTNYTSSLIYAGPFAATAIMEQSNFSSYTYLKR